MLARERDGSETAFDQASMQATHRFARRAEQNRRIRLVQAQQIHRGILDVRGGDRERLIGDIAMAALGTDGRDGQGIALIAPRQRNDRLRHRRREEQGAPALGRGIEDFLKLVAEAHVEHLVGFVENDRGQPGQIERTALEMVAQAAGRADHDMRAMRKLAPLARRIHAADTGRDPRAGLGIEPLQLTRDLQRQFARRRDHQGARQAWPRQLIALEQLRRDRHTEGDGLAGAGLRGDDQIAPVGIVFEDGGLNRRGRGIAALGQRLGEGRG